MSDYRRNRVPGGTYFFTVNLRDRSSDLLIAEIDALRNAVHRVFVKWPFDIDAWVVLPDHMHSIWTLPEGDSDYSGRWRLIKGAFSRSLPATERRSGSQLKRNERSIWQHRFWEHTIRDDDDYAAHIDYTHFNPVKHGYASSAAGWRYSSFRRCVREGVYPESWAAAPGTLADAGERG